MGRLSSLMAEGKKLSITGPYTTQVAERVARDIVERPQMAAGVPHYKYLGAGCSALLTPEGQAYIRQIACDYITSVPYDHPLVVVTPSFRLAKQVLEAAASVRGVDPHLPALGLELCLDSVSIVNHAIIASGRSRENTVIAMSVGPPFDCYRGEDTPDDIEGKYFPQVFAAVRFCHDVDYMLFETVPSFRAAVGAARTFTSAHKEFDLEKSKGSFRRTGTIQYLGSLLSASGYFGIDAAQRLAPSYEPPVHRFREIPPKKEYVLSFCLEEDGTLNHMRFDDAITELYGAIEREELMPPVGIGINCNSPALTEKILRSLSAQNRQRVIGIHPNASSENNPRAYANMTSQYAIPVEQFTASVAAMVKEFGLTIFGGCCGTDHHTMQRLYDCTLF